MSYCSFVTQEVIKEEPNKNQPIKMQGHFLTTRRRMLLELIRDSEGHLDAKELYQHASANDDSIGQATAYRSLNLFKELGLIELGVGYSITDLLVPLHSLHIDFRKYDQSIEECFVIDKDRFPKDASLVHIGIWYGPFRSKASFEFNNPDIPEYLLYKVVQCEPQIWAFAVQFS